MKIKATRDLELGDLIADFDADGTYAIVKLATNQELDLRTLDLAQVRKSLSKGSLRKALDNGWVTKVTPAATELTTEELETKLSEVLEWIISNDVYIQFLPVTAGDNPYAGSINTDVDVEIGITDGDGTIDPFNSATTVVVTITGGTAAGAQIRFKDANGNWGAYGAGPITAPFVNGKAYIQAKGTGAGTILLGLSGGNSSLDRSDTATVTLT